MWDSLLFPFELVSLGQDSCYAAPHAPEKRHSVAHCRERQWFGLISLVVLWCMNHT
jgi:hypothetical protein